MFMHMQFYLRLALLSNTRSVEAGIDVRTRGGSDRDDNEAWVNAAGVGSRKTAHAHLSISPPSLS